MKLTDKLRNRKPLLVVEFKPDDPNLLNHVEKVKPYVDAIRLTALKNASDPDDPSKDCGTNLLRIGDQGRPADGGGCGGVSYLSRSPS